MESIGFDIDLTSKGDADIIDITDRVQKALEDSGLKQGTVAVCCQGSTGSITTCEYEPGLVQDLKQAFEKLFPEGKGYAHDLTWGDANGHSHLRASFIGSGQTFIFREARLCLGTWQQIVFIDFDNRPRKRKVLLQFTGA